MKITVALYIIVLSASFSTLTAQSFGFGCLGLVGGFGGYSYQQYRADGFNEYIDDFNSNLPDSVNKMSHFREAMGYRVGINLFRGNLQGFILTIKGFYQNVSNKKTITNGEFSNTSFELKFKNWGVGIDLGTAINTSFSWKVLDAAVVYSSAVFTNTYTDPTSTNIQQFSSNSRIGYSIGSGFIISLIEEYITLEGTASYTIFSINEMKNGSDNLLSIKGEPVKNFITNGGLNGVIQVNLSFPL